MIEEGLNQLPYTEAAVTTPTGQQYNGLRYQKGNCGVSIVRSGEAMEKALQDCCRSMRIGKILVDSDTETHEARWVKVSDLSYEYSVLSLGWKISLNWPNIYRPSQSQK